MAQTLTEVYRMRLAMILGLLMALCVNVKADCPKPVEPKTVRVVAHITHTDTGKVYEVVGYDKDNRPIEGREVDPKTLQPVSCKGCKCGCDKTGKCDCGCGKCKCPCGCGCSGVCKCKPGG